MSHRWKKVRTPWEDALTVVGWDDFERRLAAWYGARGYRVEHTGTGASAARSDGGIDIKLYRDDEYVVVQCKHWNIAQVPHNAVHELIGVMHTQGASRAILITSGEFTAAARDAASRFPLIELIDGVTVREMLGPLEDVTVTAYPTHDAPSPPSWSATTRGRARGRIASSQNRLIAVALAIAAAVGTYAYAQHQLTVMSASLAHMNQQSLDNARANAAGVTTARDSAAYERRQQGMPPTRMGRMAVEGGGSVAVSIGPPVGGTSAPVTGAGNSSTQPDSTPRSKEAADQWARENAKSMKILEKTTPEL